MPSAPVPTGAANNIANFSRVPKPPPPVPPGGGGAAASGGALAAGGSVGAVNPAVAIPAAAVAGAIIGNAIYEAGGRPFGPSVGDHLGGAFSRAIAPIFDGPSEPYQGVGEAPFEGGQGQGILYYVILTKHYELDGVQSGPTTTSNPQYAEYYGPIVDVGTYKLVESGSIGYYAVTHGKTYRGGSSGYFLGYPRDTGGARSARPNPVIHNLASIGGGQDFDRYEPIIESVEIYRVDGNPDTSGNPKSKPITVNPGSPTQPNSSPATAPPTTATPSGVPRIAPLIPLTSPAAAPGATPQTDPATQPGTEPITQPGTTPNPATRPKPGTEPDPGYDPNKIPGPDPTTVPGPGDNPRITPGKDRLESDKDKLLNRLGGLAQGLTQAALEALLARALRDKNKPTKTPEKECMPPPMARQRPPDNCPDPCPDPCPELDLTPVLTKLENVLQKLQGSSIGAIDVTRCDPEPDELPNLKPYLGEGLTGLYSVTNAIAAALGVIHDRVKCPPDPPGNLAIAVPDWWPTRIGAERPQLSIVFRKGEGSNYHAINIPHPADTTPPTASPISAYRSGQFQATLFCIDNSKLVVNAETAAEARRVALEGAVAIRNDMLFSPLKLSITERQGFSIGVADMSPRYAQYFPRGHQNTMPEWRKTFD